MIEDGAIGTQERELLYATTLSDADVKDLALSFLVSEVTWGLLVFTPTKMKKKNEVIFRQINHSQ